MLRKLLSLACLSTVLVCSSLSFATSGLEKGKTYLFIQTSSKAIIEKTKDENTYLVKLIDVSPYVAYFTDRPNRETGYIPMAQFLKQWKEGHDNFAQDKPNAAIEGAKSLNSKQMDTNSYVVSLSQPVYDGKNKTLTYTAQALKGEKDLLNLDSNTLYHSVVFIDGICYGCIG